MYVWYAFRTLELRNAIEWLDWLKAEPCSCMVTLGWGGRIYLIGQLCQMNCLRSSRRPDRHLLIWNIYGLSLTYGFGSNVKYTRDQCYWYCSMVPKQPLTADGMRRSLGLEQRCWSNSSSITGHWFAPQEAKCVLRVPYLGPVNQMTKAVQRCSSIFQWLTRFQWTTNISRK